MIERSVPPRLAIRQTVLTPLGLVGCGLLIFAQIFAWIFVPASDVAALWEWRGPIDRTSGVVERIERTSFRVNSRRVHAVTFTFGDPPRSATSYAFGRPPLEPGARVDVEHPAGRPDAARIAGMLRRPMPWEAGLAPLVPFALGSTLLAVAVVAGMRRARLLRSGASAAGKLVAREPTRTRVNGKVVFRLRYAFMGEDGRSAEAVARTHRVAELSDTATVVYDAESLRAVVLDHLSGRPRLGADGEIEHEPGPGDVLAVALPALAVGGWI